jgi:hypothetical protein
MDELTLAAVLTAAGAAVAGGLVATVVQALKPLLPDAWSYGRAPMLMAAVLSGGVTGLAVVDAGWALSANAVFGGLLTWFGVYTAAVGTHATVSKASRVIAGTTDPAGPDDAPG